MSFEIEKKFAVLNYDLTLQLLTNDFGKPSSIVKAGYWWTEASDPSQSVLEPLTHRIQKKNIEMINQLAEIKIPPMDYEYVRIRVLNNASYVLTVKNKTLVNGIEQNVEYEYDIDKETVLILLNFLSQGFYVFYYNIKDTKLFQDGETAIEISQFNDLRYAYMEIEVTGDDKDALTEKLEKALLKFDHYPIKEESTSYNQLSKQENAIALRNKKLRDYSKDATKKLKDSL